MRGVTVSRFFTDPRQLLLVSLMIIGSAAFPALAQSPDGPPQQPTSPGTSTEVVYKPPLRGAPGGRVGGASRSAVRSAVPLPTIELVAPLDHTGQTASPTPTLYFFVSQAVTLPTQLTISAPLRAAPVLEVTIPSPPARGLYALRPADYHVQLEPGIVYTWSVSAIVDPQHWSRNVVASATILRVPPNAMPAAEAIAPLRRAAYLAASGYWYDAVDAAVEAQNLDRHTALDALLTEVGLTEPANFDRGQAAR